MATNNSSVAVPLLPNEIIVESESDPYKIEVKDYDFYEIIPYDPYQASKTYMAFKRAKGMIMIR